MAPASLASVYQAEFLLFGQNEPLKHIHWMWLVG